VTEEFVSAVDEVNDHFVVMKQLLREVRVLLRVGGSTLPWPAVALVDVGVDEDHRGRSEICRGAENFRKRSAPTRLRPKGAKIIEKGTAMYAKK
jgi:hypothetical protein